MAGNKEKGKSILDFVEVLSEFLDANGVHIQDVQDMKVDEADLYIDVKEFGAFTRVYKVEINEQ